jgi:peptide-methionine (S)-S-oxide reductase
MKSTFLFILSVFIPVLSLTGCSRAGNTSEPKDISMQATPTKTDTATFGNGCFWCTEAIFSQLKGVTRVESGYSGGSLPNPTYIDVTSGETGHAEVIQIGYDPDIVSYESLLEVFWSTHNPTTLNRQGADVGTQYRSVIFYHNGQQRQLAMEYKEKLDNSGAWEDPIVTEISPYKDFYKAEDYHQRYFERNRNAPYCTFVIVPKLEKFRKVFSDRLAKP